MKRRLLGLSLLALTGAALTLHHYTQNALAPLPPSLAPHAAADAKPALLDKTGRPLTVTYSAGWNVSDVLPLHRQPKLLVQAFLAAEDGRFYEHDGIDWRARSAALWQNLTARRVVRGASTLSEQAARLITPRPRTLWARWLEGFEAKRLQARFGRDALLEFYLNQVPYGARLRGTAQAARHYFDRELDTLSPAETLALAVLVRAPARLDPAKYPGRLNAAIGRLAVRMGEQGLLSAESAERLRDIKLDLRTPAPPVNARAFAAAVYPRVKAGSERVTTTLDASLQSAVQAILDRRLKDLDGASASDGAVLVVDRRDMSVRAWVNARPDELGNPHRFIDAVTTPRQPGSTLKPFVYALALEKGWTAATLVSDTPLKQAVGTGLHAYRNYSRSHYGAISVREALGNSLNVPAVRALKFIGGETLLSRLRALGVTSLTQHPDHYGEGLALGDGELSLLELVQAYGALANAGQFRKLALLPSEASSLARPVFSPEIASLIADILADPDARRREFGEGGLLRFAHAVAVKTGTSSDYRDAWAVAFDDRYLVGVWLGNLDRRSMREVTGATGPALVLRGVFAELNRGRDNVPLYLSPRLVERQLCQGTERLAEPGCTPIREWFIAGTEPKAGNSDSVRQPLQLEQPTPGLRLARDPRIPDALERFRFAVSADPAIKRVRWTLNGQAIATTTGPEWLWPVAAGKHQLAVEVTLENGQKTELGPVNFYVR